MEIKSTSFRIGALMLGVVGVTSTVLVATPSLVAIVCGVTFGAGGWLADYFTGFRKLNGQLSTWALVVGGVLAMISMRSHFKSNEVAMEFYALPIQYISVVLVCWGLLMFVVPARNREP